MIEQTKSAFLDKLQATTEWAIKIIVYKICLNFRVKILSWGIDANDMCLDLAISRPWDQGDISLVFKRFLMDSYPVIIIVSAVLTDHLSLHWKCIWAIFE
jgi:hypothetical protein